jgi:hypothetical protein
MSVPHGVVSNPRIDRMGQGRIGRLLLVAALAGGCAGQAGSYPAGPGHASPSSVAVQAGQPLDPGLRPSAETCRQQLTADVGAAKRLRAELRTADIPATDAAVTAAANDIAADITALGIPLSRAELTALHASGIFIDRASPVLFWVQAGEPQRFGGIWIDPPGSARYVVGILNSDPTALALARCLDAGIDVRYVTAARSVADDNALVARISADMGVLQSSGVHIVSVGIGVRASAMIVIVGVTGLTEAIRTELIGRYGDTIVVEEQASASPA